MTLRVLHISTRLILGGSQENTILSCEGQARLGHEVHLAFGPIYGPEGTMMPRVEAWNGAHPGAPIRTHRVPDLVRELSFRRDTRALKQLQELIADIGPDIVHTHSSKAGVLGRIAAWRVLGRNGDRGTPHPWMSRAERGVARRPVPLGPVRRPGVVHTVHGPPFMPLEGGVLRRLRIGAQNKVYELAEKVAASKCHLIACVCEAMRDEFLARGIGTAARYRIVYSGMEVETFLRRTAEDGANDDRDVVRTSLGFAPGDFVVGTVARLAEHKGHDDVLDALARDMQRDASLKLLWVGDGWWKRRLRARVAELGLEGRVAMTGLVPPERIPAMMRAMDVLVHPSAREGLPRTVPQALLSGTPVVATDVDGTREACIPGQTGCLVPAGDAHAIREGVVWMREHPEEARATAARGRTLCAERFGAEKMVQELETVYAEAIEMAEARAGSE